VMATLQRATRRLKTFAELVKFEHTVFALPFAYAGAFLAAGGWPGLDKFWWVTVAMVGARSAAMSLNRLIDRYIDARNPRTAGRPLPQGRMKVPEVVAIIVLSLVVLYLAAANLNPLCVTLFPLVVFILVAYSYTKRFTWAAHFVLGLALGFAPFGGWIAVTGTIHPASLALGVAVGLWVAGFDLIYAILDVDFDRQEGLYSIPAVFGVRRALQVSSSLHIATFLILLGLFFYLGLGYLYLAGVLVTGILLWYEHAIISPSDLSRLDVAFFNVNGIIGIIFFCFTLLDLVV